MCFIISFIQETNLQSARKNLFFPCCIEHPLNKEGKVIVDGGCKSGCKSDKCCVPQNA